MDFTFTTYRIFLKNIIGKNYTLQSFSEFLANPSERYIILRHDVDMRPQYSLRFAEIQKEFGIKGSYYFRIVPQSFDESIIRKIASLGHEIGYHYETMDTCHGNVDRAYDEFCRNLEEFRKVVPVETICMHGSPLSKYDNRKIWKKYDYRSLGILAEPYFDLDFNEVFYLTDTGRRWDGARMSIRDKAMSSKPVSNPDFLNRTYHSTVDIMRAAEQGDFPNKVMMTFHPQRWTDNKLYWLQELVLQNVKNQVKRFIAK